MKINFGKLSNEETKAIAVQAMAELTTHDIFEVIKESGVQLEDLKNWVAELEA